MTEEANEVMPETLKECPFCGQHKMVSFKQNMGFAGLELNYEVNREDKKYWYISCGVCGCELRGFTSREAVINR